METKISVIIPVYLVAQYLPECIESVLNQDYTNKEIILVDDGSPDESPAICDRFASQYSQVRVIHKKNGGLSDARNVGIKYATGDYIAFLDGDDYWDDTSALTKLVERLAFSDADVLNFSYKKYFEDTGEKICYFYQVPEMPFEKNKKSDQLAYLSQNGLFIASACNKLIRRELFTEKLLFQPGVYSEDIEWCARLLCCAKSMDFVCANFYCYRQRRDSITHTINNKKCHDLCNHIIECFSIMEASDKEEKNALYNYVAYQYGTFFKVQAEAKNEQKDCIERLAKYQWVLSYHCGNKKLVILYIGCKLLGYRRICRLMRMAYTKKREDGE